MQPNIFFKDIFCIYNLFSSINNESKILVYFSVLLYYRPVAFITK